MTKLEYKYLHSIDSPADLRRLSLDELPRYCAEVRQYIIEQCSDASIITTKKMMGDYCIYCDGVLFGLICDNVLYLKVTEEVRVMLHKVILCPPYNGAKDYFLINDVDDKDYLSVIVQSTVANLPLKRK